MVRMEELSQEEIQDKQKGYEKFWAISTNWHEGQEVKMDGMPKGTRLVQAYPTSILRVEAENAPQNEDPGKPNDVPMAAFGPEYDPREVKKVARKIMFELELGRIKVNPNIRPEIKRNAE
jgi:hypothetical protein